MICFVLEVNDFNQRYLSSSSHLSPQAIKHKNTMLYVVANVSLGLGQTQQCGEAKPVNMITSPSDYCIYNDNTDMNKQYNTFK